MPWPLGPPDSRVKLDELATPDDNRKLNASVLRHGLMPKLSGKANEFLSGSGQWSVVGAAAGSGGDPLSVVDSLFTITDDATPGKVAMLQCAGLPAGISTFAFPPLAAPGTDTLAALGLAQTFTQEQTLQQAGGGSTVLNITAASATLDSLVRFREAGDALVDYQLYHSGVANFWALWNTNIDGAGADGDILRVYDGTDDLVIPSGNIGIGITAPTSRLHVAASAAGDVLLTIQPHASQTATVARVRNAAANGDFFSIDGTGGLSGQLGTCIIGDGLTVNIPFLAHMIGGATLTWGGIYDATAAGATFFAVDGPAVGATLTFPAAGGTLVTTTAAQTLTFKTLSSGILTTGSVLQCSSLAGVAFVDTGDSTKKLSVRTNLAVGLNLLKVVTTAGRTYTLPDYNMIVAGSAAALTSGSVPIVGTGGILAEDADLSFSVDRLTVTKHTSTLETLTAAAAPGSPADGDQWNDSTQKALTAYVNALNQKLSGAFYSQAALQTVSGTAAESTLTLLGVGTLTLPASFFISGKCIRVTATGYLDTADATTPTLIMRLKKGTTTLASTTAWTMDGTAYFWRMTALIVGVSATSVAATGTLELYKDKANPTFGYMGNSGSFVTISSASEALDLTAQWSAASAANSIICDSILMEVLN